MSQEVFAKLPRWMNLEQSDHMDKPIDTIVTGQIPSWINGSMYRNGCGLYKVGPTAWSHIFDGFAVLQRWTFTEGKVTYQSSILDSDDYKKSAKHGRIVGNGFGNKFPDPCQTIFGRLLSKFVPQPPWTISNTPVNIIEFGDRLFAITETPLINEVHPDSLKVKGKVILSDLVAVHLGTAHPHVLKDGTMIYYGTNMVYPKAYNLIAIPPLTAADAPFKGAKIVASAAGRWKMNVSYSHSFGITDNYFIVLEQPLAVSLAKVPLMAVKGQHLADNLIYHQKESLDFIVIDRSTGKRTPITYKAPNGLIFHFINCYEESNHLICDACYYPPCEDFLKNKYLALLAENPVKHISCNETVYFARFVLPLSLNGAKEGTNLVTLPDTTATATLEKGSKTVVAITPETFEGNPVVELPRINYDYNGVKYRYFYGSGAHIQNRNQISKFDVIEKRVINYEVDENLTAGEPVFLPRPGATEEDDGVVLCTLVADIPEVQSLMVVLDAHTFQELGRANIPKELRMSNTFHGNFTEKAL